MRRAGRRVEEDTDQGGGEQVDGMNRELQMDGVLSNPLPR